jgi:hypothetical protein
MRQRDQNKRGNDQRPGGRYGAMAQAGREYDDGRRQQQSRGGGHFTDTYNPEPQWLREQGSGRQYGQPLGGGEYDRNDEDYRGGRYASASREPGGPARSRGYGPRRYDQYGSRFETEDDDRDDGRQAYGQGQREYGRQYQGAHGQGPYGEYGSGRDMPEPYEAGYRGGGFARSEGWEREEQRFAGVPEYGRSGRGSGHGRDYGGARQRMRQERPGSQFLSDYGGGGYDQVSGHGSDFGSRGYGTAGGFATGRYPSGMEGQRSYRGLGPQSYKRSDDRIRDDVCERLTDNDRIDASNVTIDVNQGAVTLSGTVPERHMRYAAEDLVDDCMGVESIDNQLRVQATPASGGQAGTGVGGRTGSALSEKPAH